MLDYQTDYREAQASGHHVDCDGYRTAHRTNIVRNEHDTFEAVCDECGKLGIGSSSTPEGAASLYRGHAFETACDGRCNNTTLCVFDSHVLRATDIGYV